MKYLENNKELYCFNQDEKIYFADNKNNIIDNLKLFYDEIISRKKDNVDEEGLQATGLIFDNIGCFKINENDGIDPHGITGINLLQAIKCKENPSLKEIYGTRKLASRFNLYQDDLGIIAEKGMELRIICSEKNLLVIFNDFGDEFSNLKKEIILISARVCKDLLENFKIDTVYFCFGNKNIMYETSNLDENYYNEIIDKIDNKKTDLRLK